MEQHGLGSKVTEIAAEPFTEHLFALLGSASVRSIDYSGYEGADIVHDLNEPIPASLVESCDTVFDGGSIEHIFNLPIALANLMKLVRVGGTVLSVNGANNFLGHGFISSVRSSSIARFRVKMVSTHGRFWHRWRAYPGLNLRPTLRLPDGASRS